MATTIAITATKRGNAAMWESGGGLTSRGHSVIIAAPDGSAPQAVHVRTRGDLACKDHALIPVYAGCYIIRGFRPGIRIEQILSTSVKDVDGERWEATAEVETVNTYNGLVWDHPLDPALADAVNAAASKAATYHCRGAMFIAPREERPKLTPDQAARRAARNAAQDKRRAELRDAKAARDAAALAAVEAASVAARAECADRIAALEARFAALTPGWRPDFGPVYVTGTAWPRQTYPGGVDAAEREAACQEARAEQGRIREELLPEFHALRERVESVGEALDLREDLAVISGGNGGVEYTREGLEFLNRSLRFLEERRDKAAAEAAVRDEKERADAEGAAAGLPAAVEIWRRLGGATNAGNGWVITPQGSDRAPDRAPWNDGRLVWDQVRPGELVLRWAKACTAADHEFEVIHHPGALTDAQVERVAEIQRELDGRWAGRAGMASRQTSPAVGSGWGLVPEAPSASQVKEESAELPALADGLAALAAKFSRR